MNYSGRIRQCHTHTVTSLVIFKTSNDVLPYTFL